MPLVTKVNWEPIEADRAKGLTFAELAQKYQVTESNVRQRALRYGWKAPREKVLEKTMARMVPTEKQIEERRNRVADEAAELVGKKIAQFVARSVAHAERVMDRAAEFVETAESARELRDAAGAWGVGNAAVRLALGLDSPIASQDQSWGGRRGTNLTIDLSQDDVIVTNPEQSSAQPHDSESGSAPADGPVPPPA